MTARQRSGVGWFALGFIAGFAGGGIGSYFGLTLQLSHVSHWQPVLYCDAALALILVIAGVRHAQRGGLALRPGIYFGIALSIAACWLLLFWVVGI